MIDQSMDPWTCCGREIWEAEEKSGESVVANMREWLEKMTEQKIWEKPQHDKIDDSYNKLAWMRTSKPRD